MPVSEGSTTEEPTALVLALGHEIGNLLAATRLHAHLVDADASASELADISATIGELSSRMGSLLAQVRPLLSPAPIEAPKIDPVEVLDGVRRGLEESCDERVAVDLESAAGHPLVAIDPEPLHHILLTIIYHALEASEPKGKIAVAACARDQSIAFCVDGESPLEESGNGSPKGRALVYAVAEAILRPRGAEIRTLARGGGHRVEIVVPVGHI